MKKIIFLFIFFTLGMPAMQQDFKEVCRKQLLGLAPITPDVIRNASFNPNNDFQNGEVVILRNASNGAFYYACVYGTNFINYPKNHQYKLIVGTQGYIMSLPAYRLGKLPESIDWESLEVE